MNDGGRQSNMSLLCGILSFGFNPFYLTSLTAIWLGIQGYGSGERRGRATIGALLGAGSVVATLVLLQVLESRAS